MQWTRDSRLRCHHRSSRSSSSCLTFLINCGSLSCTSYGACLRLCCVNLRNFTTCLVVWCLRLKRSYSFPSRFPHYLRTKKGCGVGGLLGNLKWHSEVARYYEVSVLALRMWQPFLGIAAIAPHLPHWVWKPAKWIAA